MAMNKKGDTVIVLSGKDKGKQGKVISAVPSEAKVVVEGINVVTWHHQAPQAGLRTGGIIKREDANLRLQVQVVCPARQAHPRRPHCWLDGKRPAPARSAALSCKKGES